MLIDGLAGGSAEDLGGPAFTIDKALGGSGNTGAAIDLFSGGLPSGATSSGLFLTNILSTSSAQDLFFSNRLYQVDSSIGMFNFPVDNLNIAPPIIPIQQ